MPGLDLRIAFGQVRDEVLKVTRNKQEPFVYGSLGGGEIALVSTNAPSQFAPAMPPKSGVDYDKEMEITFWNAVKDAKSKDLLQTYLDRYPNGNFAGLAKVLIEQLDKEQNAMRLAVVATEAAGAQKPTNVLAALPPGAQAPAGARPVEESWPTRQGSRAPCRPS